MRNLKYIAFVLFLLCTNIFAQNEKITISAENKSFEETIEQIEQLTGYHFFFKSEWFIGLSVTLNETNTPTKEVLDKMIQGTELSFIILNDNKIVFSNNYNIKTNYAASYSSYLNNRINYEIDSSIYAVTQQKEQSQNSINKEYQIFTIGNPAINSHKTEAIINGYIKDVRNGEPVIGAIVYVDKLQAGSVTNMYGYYTITLPKGQHKVEFRSMGMQTTQRNVHLYSNGSLDVEMYLEPTTLKEVVVTHKSDNAVTNLRMGMEKLSIKSVKQLPSGFGEADIIKSTLLLPGVQTAGEASSGFNVRGGSIDQNLIMLNDAPIMNTSHFFGFLSGFNADVVKNITLYKSGIPAKYGGRVSSVMDISMKEGNKKKFKINGGISPISGKATIEASIVKDKASLILGVRKTYSDWVLNMIKDENISKSKAGFYDIQGNLSYDINKNNSLYLSGYYSHDDFDYYAADAYSYNSMASTLKWKHIFNPKLFSLFSASTSNYNYYTTFREIPANLHNVDYNLDQHKFIADFSYHPGINHKFSFGVTSSLYLLDPGKSYPIGEESLFEAETLESEQAIEGAVYLGDEFELNNLLSFSAGVRYNYYASFGPKTVNTYASDLPISEQNINGSTTYASGEIIKSYSSPDIRLASKLKLNHNNSVKIGFDRLSQFIHMISNTTSMSPTDIWKLSDTYLSPQKCDQYSIGYYQNLKKRSIELSVEAYYKNLTNIIDYKGGAELTMNEHLETDVLNGEGKAYGIELMIEKKRGKLTGWVNYTYSRSLHKLDSEYKEERVNNGNYFSSNYDKPNEFKVAANYKFSRRFNISSNFYYSTGRPYTAPLSYYEYYNVTIPYYSDRNALRMDDYIRLDFAATLNGSLQKKKLLHSSWTFAVMNVLGRKNTYSIYFRSEGADKVQGYKMSIIGQPIFTLTYNFKIFGNANDDF